MRRDEATLLDIAHAAREVQDFIQGFEKNVFLGDLKTKSAVLYQLLVIGEAVKRLSFEFRDQHSEIPWSSMAGMRDHLIQGYDIVDWKEVWKTVTADIPDLLNRIKPMLPKNPSDS